MKPFSLLLSLFLLICIIKSEDFDIVIYGATGAGLSAAIAAKRIKSNAKIAIIEPTNELGGMTVAGSIGLRDVYAKRNPMIGTIGQEWVELNSKHYKVKEGVFQPETRVGKKSWNILLARENLQIVYNTTLLEKDSVTKSGTTIKSIKTFRTGTDNKEIQEWSGKVFIDASYEGDLARFAGVSFTFGREARSTYNEKDAGVLPYDPRNNFPRGKDAISPFVSLTNHTLLWTIDPRELPSVGSADDRMMGYSFRACVTNDPKIRAPFFKPPQYDPEHFTLLQRRLDLATKRKQTVLFKDLAIITSYHGLPNKNKLDLCNGYSGAWTVDAPYLNNGYVTASYKRRQEIWDLHYEYLVGMLYYLSSDKRVPLATRRNLSSFGFCKDEWPEYKNVPPQLYVREGLRIIGDKVMNQNDFVQYGFKNDSIGITGWWYDVHEVSRVVARDTDGSYIVNQEGERFNHPADKSQAEIPISVLFPKKSEATNLIVPVCLSASHIAYAALRLEPTFVELAQASAYIATYSIDHQSAVQDTPVKVVQNYLVSLGISIHWNNSTYYKH